jgi:hypothetical protein
MRRLVTWAAAATVVVCATAPARADIPPVKVIDEPGDQQLSASGNGTWYVFTSDSSAHPNRYDAYAQHVDGTNRTRLNPQGTAGHAGNFDPSANRVIYDQRSSTTPSNLWFFDLGLQTRSRVPGVNTKKWYEYDGLVATGSVLFDRDHRMGGVWYTDLILFDRVAGTGTVLGSWKAGRVFVTPGSVGNATASYEVVKVTARAITINAFVYDIGGGTRSKIPVPAGRFAYAPTVDETNREVYFVRSGKGCGRNVSLRRVTLDNLDAAQEVLASLPDRVDAGGLSLAPNTGAGNTDLLFTRYSCRTNAAHIFSLPGVAP